ncbi:MAG: cytochrome c, partial [Myxococcota bacterium]
MKTHRPLRSVAAWVFSLSLVACTSPTFGEALVLGGRTISADALNRGHTVYLSYCASCHGVVGDGKGPAAASIVPPPRDFTRTEFRYVSVPKGSLPTDEDLLRVLDRGVPGTHMSAWQGLDAPTRQAVVDYLKTFSPRWRTETPRTPLVLPADPWAGSSVAAVARGAEIYHGTGNCSCCHPTYQSDRAVGRAGTGAVGEDPRSGGDPG